LVNTIVVHRPDDDAIRELAAQYRAYPVAMRSGEGELSDTLRTGIEVLSARDRGEARAVLICMGDQPLLRLDVMNALLDGWKSGAVAVRPAYRDAPGEPGHPLLLDRSLWGYATELRGESGFAPVLAARGITVRTIPVGGSNPDVDTLEDLQALDLIPGVTAELRTPEALQ
jgi:CTP:molybdopterin cytidylyltransferase MocA